jgi:hypothetical protein
MSKQKLLKKNLFVINYLLNSKRNIVVFTMFKVKLNESNLNMFYVYLFFLIKLICINNFHILSIYLIQVFCFEILFSTFQSRILCISAYIDQNTVFNAYLKNNQEIKIFLLNKKMFEIKAKNFI